MNKRKNNKLHIILALTFATNACTPLRTNESEVKQLTNSMFSCYTAPQSVVEQVTASFPSDAVRGMMQSEIYEMREIIANMPDKHIADVSNQATANGYVFSYDGTMSGGLEGLTAYNYAPVGSCVSTELRDPSSMPVLLHEIGHCIHALQDNVYPQEFSNQGTDVVSRIYEDGKSRRSQLQNINPPVRDYAFQSKHELFAESYNNFYCSSEANQYLYNTFPMMHQLMAEKFGAPRWEVLDGTAATSSNVASSAISRDVLVKLLPGTYTSAGKYKSFVEVFVPSNIEQVKLCFGLEATCLANPTSNLNVSYNRVEDGMRVFKSITTAEVEPGSAVTALGYDAANTQSPTVVKGVKFNY